MNGEHDGIEEEEIEDMLCDITPHPNAPMGISCAPQLADDTFDEYQGMYARQSIVEQLEGGNIR